MSLITIDDIRAELPRFAIADTGTVPTTAQTERYIATVEAEVRALAVGKYGVWPDDPDTDAGQFLARTITEGVRYLVLRAVFSTSRGTGVPDEFNAARDAYNDRIKRLGDVLAGMRTVSTVAAGGTRVPVMQAPAGAPGLSGSFEEWTRRVDYDNGIGGNLYRPGARLW